jgi:dephospho-CoA kinase
MKIIGLTGGIGSGKSTVLNFFKEFEVPVYVSDIEAKKIMHTSEDVIFQVTKLFGKEAYIAGKLNRKLIADIVFADKEKLKTLNEIVHPAVHKDFQEFVKRQKTTYVVYESALLFENKSEIQFDTIVLIVAPLRSRIERVQKRDQATIPEIAARIKNQLPDEYKIDKSDYVLLNTDLSRTKKEVQRLHNLFRS